MSHKLALRQQRLIPFKRHILGARFEHEVSPRWPWYKLQKGGRIHNYPQGFTRKLFRKGGYFPLLPSKNRRINISNLLTSENPCAANSQKNSKSEDGEGRVPFPASGTPVRIIAAEVLDSFKLIWGTIIEGYDSVTESDSVDQSCPTGIPTSRERLFTES